MESNAEHWNALLLSLRELTEWVIRKDTELSTLSLGPVKGDAANLQKQLVSYFITFFVTILFIFDQKYQISFGWFPNHSLDPLKKYTLFEFNLHVWFTQFNKQCKQFN